MKTLPVEMTFHRYIRFPNRSLDFLVSLQLELTLPRRNWRCRTRRRYVPAKGEREKSKSGFTHKKDSVTFASEHLMELLVKSEE